MKDERKTFLITGGANGIGKSIANALLRNGLNVCVADSDAPALDDFFPAEITPQTRERFFGINVNLASIDGCINSIEKAAQRFGGIDGVFNNAAIGASSIRDDAEKNLPTIEEISPEIWDRFFNTNVRAPMVITRAALPYMRSRCWGRIVNITTSYRTMLRVLPYGATKSALESMSAVWAKELAGTGITVNVLVPGGPTDTQLIADGSGWPRNEMLAPSIMVLPALWLISDQANEVTGMRITAKKWDNLVGPQEALKKSARLIGWPELAAAPASWQQAQE